MYCFFISLFTLLFINVPVIASFRTVDNFTDTPLHQAISRGTKLSSIPTEWRAYISQPNRQGQAPLHLAVKKNYIPNVRILLNAGADIEQSQSSYSLSTALDIALKRRSSPSHIAMIELLLSHGAKVGKRIFNLLQDTSLLDLALRYGAEVDVEHNGQTPLLSAISKLNSLYFANNTTYNLKVIQLLLKYGANANKLEQNSQNSVTHLAILRNNVDALQMLMKHTQTFNHLNSYQESPLHFACQQPNPVFVKILLEQNVGIDIRNKDSETPLYQAIKNNFVEHTEMLLDAGANLSMPVPVLKTPLYIAVEKRKGFANRWSSKDSESLDNNFKILESLFIKGARCNQFDEDNLRLSRNAIEIDDETFTELFFKYLSPSTIDNNFGQILLQLACKKNNSKALELLLALGITTDYLTDKQETLLHILLRENHHENTKSIKMAQHLVAAGVDINARDQLQITALHLALQNLNRTIVLWAIEQGANVNAVSQDGKTPLLLAGCDTEFMTHLLEAGADPNLSSESPLHNAWKSRYWGLVKQLFEYNASANIQLTNFKYNSPLHEAVAERDPILVQYLLSRGASVSHDMIKNVITDNQHSRSLVSQANHPFQKYLIDDHSESENFDDNKDIDVSEKEILLEYRYQAWLHKFFSEHDCVHCEDDIQIVSLLLKYGNSLIELKKELDRTLVLSKHHSICPSIVKLLQNEGVLSQSFKLPFGNSVQKVSQRGFVRNKYGILNRRIDTNYADIIPDKQPCEFYHIAPLTVLAMRKTLEVYRANNDNFESLKHELKSLPPLITEIYFQEFIMDDKRSLNFLATWLQKLDIQERKQAALAERRRQREIEEEDNRRRDEYDEYEDDDWRDTDSTRYHLHGFAWDD